MAAIPGIMVDIGANVARMQQDMRKLTGTMESGFGQMASSARKLAGILGLAFGVREIVGFGQKVLDAGDQLAKMSQSTGVSVENLSVLKYAASLADVELEGLAKGLGILSRNMLDAQAGTGEAKDAMAALGLSIQDAKGNLLSSDKVMGQVADKFAALEDGSTKTALAMKIFGKSGAAMIPLLNAGSASLAEMREEAEKLGLVMSTETAQQMERVNDNFTRLKSILEGVAVKIVSGVIPTLENLTNILFNAAKETGNFEEASRGISATLKLVASGAYIAYAYFMNYADAIRAVVLALRELSWGQFTNAFEVLESGHAQYLKNVQNMVKTLEKIWDDAATVSKDGAKKVRGSLGIGQKLETDKVEESLQKIIDKLFEEVEALQMGESAIELYRHGLHNASADQKEYATYLLQIIQAQKDATAYSKELAKVQEADILANYEAMGKRMQAAADAKADLYESGRKGLADSEEKAILDNYENLIRNRQAMADAEAKQIEHNAQVLIDFADRVRAQNRMTADYAIEQIERQAKEFRAAGADEVAVAIWAAKEKQKASREWSDGAARAFESYAADATNAAKNVETAITSGLNTMEDALVEFVKTGKLNFKSLVDSIIADLTRLMIRQTITGPTASMLGQLFTSLFSSGAAGMASGSGLNVMGASGAWGYAHEGKIIGPLSGATRNLPAAYLAGAPRYHGGLQPDEFPTILRRGEGVFTPEQMAAMGGRTNISISVPVNMPGGNPRKAGQMRRELENELEPLVRRIVERYS